MAKCSCGVTKINGLCPHGCEAFRKPHARTAIPAAKAPREQGAYLSAAEAAAGARRVLGAPQRWTGTVSAKRVAEQRRR